MKTKFMILDMGPDCVPISNARVRELLHTNNPIVSIGDGISQVTMNVNADYMEHMLKRLPLEADISMNAIESFPTFVIQIYA